MAEQWNPWRELRLRPNVTFIRKPLPPGAGEAVCALWPDGDAVVVVDTKLLRRQRNEALAHELVHLERGAGSSTQEEGRVHREVARRLIPLDVLRLWVDRRVASDLTVTPFDVAEDFDCTPQLGLLALTLLGQE